MRYFNEFGIAVPELGWVPSPTFILRRAAILDQISQWPIGSVLEVGCGSGAISYELARKGFCCTAIETSARAQSIAQHIFADSPLASIHSSLPESKTPYDYLISFEVLEHIEDDVAALQNWVNQLRPGGKCLLSVPAHTKRWNVTDIAAGHYRRYDRSDILSLLEDCGLHSIKITTYGWPASRLIECIRNMVCIVQLRKSGIDPGQIVLGDAERTGDSGVERSLESRLFTLYGSFLGRKLMQLLIIMQRPFINKDWGVSYLVSAEK